MRKEAIEYTARMLLIKWGSMQKHNNLEDALKYAICYGCGFTIGRPGKNDFGDYWYVWANTNLTLELLVGHGQNLREETVSKKEFMAIARHIWQKEKQGQLSLFNTTQDHG